MHRTTTRWTTAAAAAALIALPVAGAAQTPAPTPTQPPAAQQPAPQQPTAAEQPATAGQVDAAAAKKHLSEARETLSEITSMPEAAKLQGEGRTQVSQLISNFNELITTQSEWRAAYAKVDANLSSLLGPEGSEPPAAAPVGTAGSGTAGTAGTSGAASGAVDPAIRAKLVEFRSKLKQFEQAAGGVEPTSGAMAPSAATASTSNPANPTASTTPADPTANPASPTQPTTAGATGTTGVTTSPTGSMAPADQAKAAEQVGHSEADQHLDAITEILNASKTGTLTKAQTTELKKHVDQLRLLLKQGK